MHSILFMLLAVSLTTCAQSVSTRMGARAAAMGNAAFAATDESSLFQNVGAMGFTKSPSVFFSYELTPELPGANRTSTAVTLPMSWGTLAAGAFRFGDDLYSEQMITAGLGNRIGSTSLGAKVNMLQYRADGFGSRTAFTVDVGGLTQLTPEWSVGAGIFNINQANLSDDEPLPTIFVASVGWQPKGGPMIILETEKSLHQPVRFRGGVEVSIREKLFIRTGFALQPTTLTGGVGIRKSRLCLDFATAFHQTFSFLYQASASYRLTQGKKS